MRPSIWRRRLAGVLGIVPLAALTVITVRAVSSHGGATPAASTSTTKPTATPPARLTARVESKRLPSPLSGEAVVADGARLLVIGGLDSTGTSSQSVLSFDPATGKLEPAGSLAEPLHDAAAAVAGGRVLVFGGGATSSSASVETLAAGTAAQTVGSLPRPRSDLAALTVGSRVYVLGGYDGVSPTKPVLATRNGTRFATVANLAVPVRYPAVAATPQSIFIFGGETAAGTPTDAIQELDLTTGRTRVVGRLPAALDHASAATLAGRVYLLGGDVDGSPTDRIWRLNPRSGAIRGAGRLPHPVADAAAATIGDTAYLVGGVTAGTEPLDTVVSVAAASVPRN